MDFVIEEIDEFSGSMAHIYTIRPNGSDTTLLEDFYSEHKSNYSEELKEITNILFQSGHRYGCRETFFKPYEGKPGDGVAALRVGNLRIYCLLIGRIAVVLGSGGYKPPDINAYQENDLLNEKAEQMIGYARQINKKITDRDITITPDGKLIINNWED